MQLSVSDLINFYRCERLLFLNHFGDKSQKSAPVDFLKKIWKIGRDYESKVTDFFKYEKPRYKIGKYEDGFNATLDLMKKGTDIIYQGVLKNDELRGIPDFLIKTNGYSLLGDYYYFPVDIKGASTSRERYLFQLASYAYLLGDIQGFTPLYGGLLLLDLDLQIKYFYTFIKQITSAISESKNILSNPNDIPDLFIDSNCNMCQWYNFCLPEAKERKHLSLVPGVTRKIKADVEKASLRNYTELASCNDDNISKEIILQAKSLKEKKIYLKSIPDLKETKKEVFIDFESDLIMDEKGTELKRIDYLIGLLKYENKSNSYLSLLLNTTEEQLLLDFEKYLATHLEHTFYHYGHYEQTIFDTKWDKIPKVNLVDLEKVIKEFIIMPVTNYSLKHIANLLGFKWKNKEANAMQSMCWYSSYLDTGDKKFLDMSIQYNQDDCLALLFIKNWLVSLKENNLPVQTFIDIL
ncbi:MAG: TM0106 family RecB-like putative nuclease [Candidatus Melainabacteria bacterium]|nr:TM0106 family RecB-like putative nuclease [Candidatus Melainabacteria bacterium]